MADRGGEVSTAPARVLGVHFKLLLGLGVGLRVLGYIPRSANRRGVRRCGYGPRRAARPSSGARLFRPGLVFARTPSKLDELLTEVLLGCEGIVGVAAQREIVLSVLAAPREGRQVVELKAVGFGAALSEGVDVSAARFVPLEDGAADRGGDVSTAPARELGPLGFELWSGFQCRLTLRRRATCVLCLGRGLLWARHYGMLPSLELGHEGAHRAELDFRRG
jgi:hypothetical protein